MEFRDQWHFANSEENRTRLSAYWTATLFAIDCGWRVGRIGHELASHEQETWDDLRRNLSFVLDELPTSYQEKIASITKLLFAHIIPTGKSFTKEDVEAQQPDTEDYIDVKTMAPGTFAEPPHEDPPKPAAGDSAPSASGSVSVTVETAEVTLKSKPKAVSAAAPAATGSSSSQYRPQATARLEEHATGYVKAYWMEEHLSEYQCAMVTNSDGNEVPGILFNGTAYELELITASDVETIAGQVNVDKRFADFATRVNKVCRGHASCSKVPMDKDLWIDLEDFAKAFRKEVPPDVFITVSNLFGTAMKIDKHGKSRFQFLCARIPDFPVDNGLDTMFYPVKIRAIQGHSEIALKNAGGLYANSTMVYCVDNVSHERKAAFTGVPICAMTEVPDIAYHRTMKSNWKSIAKNGLIPGGGDSVNSGRAHVYMSEHRIGTDGYRSGLRAKCPIEIKIAMKQAVEGGVIFSRTEMDGILSSERIPPQYIISISEDGKVIWSRAESNLEPSTWTGAEASSSPTSKKVQLTARDDSKPSQDDPMDDTSTGQPVARPADDDATTGPMQVDQPPARVRRVYVAPKYCEPFTGECPLCLVEYVSGQVTCTTCGYEPLPVDESGEAKGQGQANRRTRILEKRMQKLAGFGMYGKMNSTLLTALTNEQADMLRREMGSRGITSIESSVIKECRDRHKRAKTLGYEDVEDRYASDVTFCDRVHEEGRGLSDCIFDDMFAYANLPDPPRTRAQISAGVAANAQNESCLSKLVYMSQPRGVEGFPIEFRKTWKKIWGFMFGRHIFTEDEYVSYIGRKGAYRGLLTWKGTVQVPADGTLAFLEKLYEENLPLVRGNLERKEKQSAAAKAGGPGGQKADPTVVPTAERKRKAEADTSATGQDDTAASSSARADASSGSRPTFLTPEPPTPKGGARPFLEPETPPTAKAASTVASKAASSGRPDASWSWNRDHYGARREWSFWRGAWYYRDEAGGRWIYWNR